MAEEKEELINKDYILKHKYNPEFTLLSEDEVEKLFSDLNLKSFLDLPKISINDPVCQLFNPKINDVFKIKRKSYTSGESIFYRVVIDE